MKTLYWILINIAFFIFILFLIQKNIKNIKYRIKEIKFPTAPSFYLPQYKIIIFWVYMDENRGHLTYYSNKVYCYTYLEALNRIEKHKIRLKQTNEWVNKEIKITDIL
jgi:hypothetical protein